MSANLYQKGGRGATAGMINSPRLKGKAPKGCLEANDVLQVIRQAADFDGPQIFA